MLKPKHYCIDCGIKIVFSPGFMDMITGTKSQPVEYKDGYRCSQCHYAFKENELKQKIAESKEAKNGI